MTTPPAETPPEDVVDDTTPPTALVAITRVMADIGAVAKAQRNETQGYSFRGVDSVVNAVAPVLRRHQVVVVPVLEDASYSTVEIGQKRTPMGHVTVRVRYLWYGPLGDCIDAVVVGEAMDSGDKAVPKAMSVAYRIVLLQTLCLPTDDLLDPDEESYERSTPAAAQPPAQRPAKAQGSKPAETVSTLRAAIGREVKRLGMTPTQAEEEFTRRAGESIRETKSLDALRAYRDHLSLLAPVAS